MQDVAAEFEEIARLVIIAEPYQRPDRIGPVAFFKSALVVQRLPKTRSGKILRGTMQKMADNQSWTMPATIAITSPRPVPFT